MRYTRCCERCYWQSSSGRSSRPAIESMLAKIYAQVRRKGGGSMRRRKSAREGRLWREEQVERDVDMLFV